MSPVTSNPLIRFRAKPDLVKRIDRVAKKKSLTRENIVRLALAEFLEKEEA